MSLQQHLDSELGVFRELALEEQDRLNALPELPDNPKEACSALSDQLRSVVAGRRIILRGLVVLPVIDEIGNLVGQQVTSEPVDVICTGVALEPYEEEFEGETFSRAVLGYAGYLKTLVRETNVGHSKVDLMVFAPIEASELIIPEADMPEFSEVLPAEDDELALQIKDSLSQEPMDLLQLDTIFGELFRDASMRGEFYLQYLNHLFSNQDVDLDLGTNLAYRVDEYDGKIYQMKATEGEDLDLEGDVNGFRCIWVGDKLSLCFEIESELHNGDTILIPVDGLHPIQATDLPTDTKQ